MMDRAVTGWSSGPVTERVELVLAPNPGPMTLTGTNTWIIHEPGTAFATVVDPGPAHDGHLDAVEAAVAARGARIAMILLTHGHDDHAAAAPELARRCGAGVRPVTGGEVIDVDGVLLGVLATPGHTSDSVSLLVAADAALLTGDTILGWGPTVVAHPDGRLADYFRSLDALAAVVATGEIRVALPGHGPIITDPVAAVERCKQHRMARLAQVRAAADEGIGSAQDIVRTVYADVDPRLWPAAELSVRAQLDYLAEE
jgi:glyoxylase-like metal-dependent hydrolase (beta-lactamase superfamily II)